MLTAEQRYGKYYLHTRHCSVFLSRCVTSVAHDRMMFARFFALLKKHHMLALLSAVRLHKVQAMMNLRQVLEAGAAAAFAIARPELEHFAEVDDQNILEPSQALAKKRYKWLEKNFPSASATLKKKKDLLNRQSTHANVVNSARLFDVNAAGDTISSPFFDAEDDYHVKTDLWLISSVSIELMDFFYGVNTGLNSIDFIPNFVPQLQMVAKENDELLAEMKSTDRFKTAMAKVDTKK